MKTNVQKTSIDSYAQVQKETQHLKILQYIDNNEPCSIGEVAKGLTEEKSTISARMNELYNGIKKNGQWIMKPRLELYGTLNDAVSGKRTHHWQMIRKEAE